MAQLSGVPGPREVVGEGLDAVPDAVARLRSGVSARKLVVTVTA